MKGFNKVFLIGNIGSSPKLTYTKDGVPKVVLNLYQSEKWTNKKTNETQEITERHRLVFFRGLAEYMNLCGFTGTRLHVEGKLHTRSWKDKMDQTRYITEVIVTSIINLSPLIPPGQESSKEADQNDLAPAEGFDPDSTDDLL